MAARLVLVSDGSWLLDALERTSVARSGAAALEDVVVGVLEDEPDGPRRSAYEGLLEGLREPEGGLVWPNPLEDDDNSAELYRRAGVLTGRVLAGLVAIASVDNEFALTAASYASALAAPQGQRTLRTATESDVLKGHVYACILTERHGHMLSIDQELVLIRWLYLQTIGHIGQDGEARALRLRAKRHERSRRVD